MEINVADESTYVYTDNWYFLRQRHLDLGYAATKWFNIQHVVCVECLQQFMDKDLSHLSARIVSYDATVILIMAQFPVDFISQFTWKEFVQASAEPQTWVHSLSQQDLHAKDAFRWSDTSKGFGVRALAHILVCSRQAKEVPRVT
jgi:hypothetical protein